MTVVKHSNKLPTEVLTSPFQNLMGHKLAALTASWPCFELEPELGGLWRLLNTRQCCESALCPPLSSPCTVDPGWFTQLTLFHHNRTSKVCLHLSPNFQSPEAMVCGQTAATQGGDFHTSTHGVQVEVLKFLLASKAQPKQQRLCLA